MTHQLDKTEQTATEVSPNKGLSKIDIAERIAKKQVNAVKKNASRSYWYIIRANTFTRFNAILGLALVAIIIFAPLRDALFGLVLIANTLIGIIQETRAKWTLERLSLISTPKTSVVRDSLVIKISQKDVVLDDIIELHPGDQVIADGTVLISEELEIDESMLTGESETVVKNSGDKVLSGSFVVAGSGRFHATAVGKNSYANKLASEARKFTLVNSELQVGINCILRAITWIMLPTGGFLLLSQIRVYNSVVDAIPGTVAGLIGMVPMGLVLLTSVAFAVSVIILGKKNVLVQELPAVEGLARVDVVCLDKTGTLTDGKICFENLIPLNSDDTNNLNAILGAFATNYHNSSTMQAIAENFKTSPGWICTDEVPFSSSRKWSAKSFSNNENWVLGAPEILLNKTGECSDLKIRVKKITSNGLRVLLLAKAKNPIKSKTLPNKLVPIALLLLKEHVRNDATETLKYFREQNVTIKVISGDHPNTVAAVAKEAGLQNIGKPIDGQTLPNTNDKLAAIMEKNTVFGRVNPKQKRSMVAALQSEGHVVAMTGDGVNDVLSLKKADIGIAMGTASPATKSVAQLILVDNRFSTLPGVVYEGRKVTGNIERVAGLFIIKTVYATFLSIIIGFAGWAFILLPRHISLVDILTIGTPAFFLSLAATKKPYRPGFVKRVLKFAIPTGLVAGLAALVSNLMARVYNFISFPESRTMATFVLIIVGLWVLAVLARPYTWWRILLIIAMIFGLIIVFTVPGINNFFALNIPNWNIMFKTLGIGVFAILLIELFWWITGGRPKPIS
jgi:cation-transporting P-type ATPase E